MIARFWTPSGRCYRYDPDAEHAPRLVPASDGQRRLIDNVLARYGVTRDAD